MALIIPPGFLHAVYELALAGDSEAIVTTCGHEIDSASGATAEDSADDLFGAFATTVMQWTPNVYTLTGVTTYIGQDGGPPVVVTSSATPVVGASTQAALPQNCSYLVRKRTDLAGKRGRGRFYMPGPQEAQVDAAGNIEASALGFVQGGWDDFYAELATTVGNRLYPPVVLHRSEGEGTEPPPTPITAFVVEGRIATQRSRLRK